MCNILHSRITAISGEQVISDNTCNHYYHYTINNKCYTIKALIGILESDQSECVDNFSIAETLAVVLAVIKTSALYGFCCLINISLTRTCMTHTPPKSKSTIKQIFKTMHYLTRNIVNKVKLSVSRCLLKVVACPSQNPCALLLC